MKMRTGMNMLAALVALVALAAPAGAAAAASGDNAGRHSGRHGEETVWALHQETTVAKTFTLGAAGRRTVEIDNFDGRVAIHSRPGAAGDEVVLSLRQSWSADAAAKIDEALARSTAKGARDELAIVGRTLYLHTPDGFGNSELAAAVLRIVTSPRRNSPRAR